MEEQGIPWRLCNDCLPQTSSGTGKPPGGTSSSASAAVVAGHSAVRRMARIASVVL